MSAAFEYLAANAGQLRAAKVSRYYIAPGEIDGFVHHTQPLLPDKSFDWIKKCLVAGNLVVGGIAIGVGQALRPDGKPPYRGPLGRYTSPQREPSPGSTHRWTTP